MQNLTPEQREQMMARMRGRGGEGGRGSDAGATTGRRGQGAGTAAKPPVSATGRGSATTIDALFGPLPQVETRGQVWVYADKQMKPVRLRLGITDGQTTELLEGDLSRAPSSSRTSPPAMKLSARSQGSADSRRSWVPAAAAAIAARDRAAIRGGGGGNNRGGGGRTLARSAIYSSKSVNLRNCKL